MPTANRREFVPVAIELFLAQDYVDKELVVVDDGTDSVADLVPPSHPQIHYVPVPSRLRLGSKRNLACEVATGDAIVHWDDDDWHAPWRLSYQLEALESGRLDVCGLDAPLFVDADKGQSWEYVHPRVPSSKWVCGATLCYRKSFWATHRFLDIDQGEDSRFVFSARGARVGALDDNRFYVGRIHPKNSCPKRPHETRWQPRPIQLIRALIGSDWEPYFGGLGGSPQPPVTAKQGTALVSSASGIGDILRITPLVRVAHRLGYVVDVLLRPDDTAVADLLGGAREIRRLVIQEPHSNGASLAAAYLKDTEYDVATFTRLSAPLGRWVKTKRRFGFDPAWRTEGELAIVQKLARRLGWEGALPAPFAMKSRRRFDVPFDTVALHPGCKPNWPWKKWHGFDELAEHFHNVAVVGTAADLDNAGTYFKRAFRWPAHVRNFVGTLDLRDTAALLSQCAMLVSIDSGLMHLGVALGIRTFGIFGITSPERECFRSPLMLPITKGLPCEAACRRDTASRRDCERHLECLKALSAEEVAAFVKRSNS